MKDEVSEVSKRERYARELRVERSCLMDVSWSPRGPMSWNLLILEE